MQPAQGITGTGDIQGTQPLRKTPRVEAADETQTVAPSTLFPSAADLKERGRIVMDMREVLRRHVSQSDRCGDPELLAIAGSWLRNLSDAVFSQAERAFVELVVNGADAMCPGAPTGQFGVGALSILGWLGPDQPANDIEYTTKTADGDQYSVAFCFDPGTQAPQLGLCWHSHVGWKTGTRVTIHPKEGVFAAEFLAKVRQVLLLLDYDRRVRYEVTLPDGKKQVIGRGQPGSPIVRVTLKPEVMSVQDAGPGMSVETLFKCFLRPHASTKVRSEAMSEVPELCAVVQDRSKSEPESSVAVLRVGEVVIARMLLSRVVKIDERVADILISFPQQAPLTLARNAIRFGSDALEAADRYLLALIGEEVKRGLREGDMRCVELLYLALQALELQSGNISLRGRFTSALLDEVERVDALMAPAFNIPTALRYVVCSPLLVRFQFDRTEDALMRSYLDELDPNDPETPLLRRCALGQVCLGTYVLIVDQKLDYPMDFGLARTLFVSRSYLGQFDLRSESCASELALYLADCTVLESGAVLRPLPPAGTVGKVDMRAKYLLIPEDSANNIDNSCHRNSRLPGAYDREGANLEPPASVRHFAGALWERHGAAIVKAMTAKWALCDPSKGYTPLDDWIDVIYAPASGTTWSAIPHVRSLLQETKEKSAIGYAYVWDPSTQEAFYVSDELFTEFRRTLLTDWLENNCRKLGTAEALTLFGKERLLSVRISTEVFSAHMMAHVLRRIGPMDTLEQKHVYLDEERLWPLADPSIDDLERVLIHLLRLPYGEREGYLPLLHSLYDSCRYFKSSEAHALPELTPLVITAGGEWMQTGSKLWKALHFIAQRKPLTDKLFPWLDPMPVFTLPARVYLAAAANSKISAEVVDALSKLSDKALALYGQYCLLTPKEIRALQNRQLWPWDYRTHVDHPSVKEYMSLLEELPAPLAIKLIKLTYGDMEGKLTVKSRLALLARGRLPHLISLSDHTPIGLVAGGAFWDVPRGGLVLALELARTPQEFAYLYAQMMNCRESRSDLQDVEVLRTVLVRLMRTPNFHQQVEHFYEETRLLTNNYRISERTKTRGDFLVVKALVATLADKADSAQPTAVATLKKPTSSITHSFTLGRWIETLFREGIALSELSDNSLGWFGRVGQRAPDPIIQRKVGAAINSASERSYLHTLLAETFQNARDAALTFQLKVLELKDSAYFMTFDRRVTDLGFEEAKRSVTTVSVEVTGTRGKMGDIHPTISVKDGAGMYSLKTLLAHLMIPDYSPDKQGQYLLVGQLGNGSFQVYAGVDKVIFTTRLVSCPDKIFQVTAKPVANSEGQIDDLLVRLTDISDDSDYASFLGTSVQVILPARSPEDAQLEMEFMRRDVVSLVGSVAKVTCAGWDAWTDFSKPPKRMITPDQPLRLARVVSLDPSLVLIENVVFGALSGFIAREQLVSQNLRGYFDFGFQLILPARRYKPTQNRTELKLGEADRAQICQLLMLEILVSQETGKRTRDFGGGDVAAATQEVASYSIPFLTGAQATTVEEVCKLAIRLYDEDLEKLTTECIKNKEALMQHNDPTTPPRVLMERFCDIENTYRNGCASLDWKVRERMERNSFLDELFYPARTAPAIEAEWKALLKNRVKPALEEHAQFIGGRSNPGITFEQFQKQKLNCEQTESVRREAKRETEWQRLRREWTEPASPQAAAVVAFTEQAHQHFVRLFRDLTVTEGTKPEPPKGHEFTGLLRLALQAGMGNDLQQCDAYDQLLQISVVGLGALIVPLGDATAAIAARHQWLFVMWRQIVRDDLLPQLQRAISVDECIALVTKLDSILADKRGHEITSSVTESFPDI